MHDYWPAGRHDQPAVWRTNEFRDATLDLAGIAHADWCQLNSKGRRHRLDGTPLAGAGGISAIPKDCRSGYPRRDLFEQLQPFPADTVLGEGKTGGVSTRPR